MSLVLLALAVVLVLACGVFVAAEFAFVTVDRGAVRRRAAEGSAAAASLDKALGHLSTHLSSAQVGITLTNLAIGFLAEPAIAQLLTPLMDDIGVPEALRTPVALTLALVLANVVTMVYGELVPKNLAIADPMRTALWTVRPMSVFTAVARGPVLVCNGLANAIVRGFGVEPQEELRSVRSPQEIASLVRRSANEGVLDSDTAALVERSLTFGERTADDVMTPRVRMHTIASTASVADVVDLSRTSGHSRFPVTGQDADEIVGMAHLKNALGVALAERAEVSVATIMQEAPLVPGTLQLDPLLTRLREDGLQAALVVDEYGGTAGIVTLEDLVEELVGEIADEHDTAAAEVRRRRDGSWSLSGMLRPDEVAERTGVRLPEGEHYDTLGGLVMQSVGRIPTTGDEVSVDIPREVDLDGDGDEPVGEQQVLLRVERMDGRRVDRVRMELRDELWAGPLAAEGAR